MFREFFEKLGLIESEERKQQRRSQMAVNNVLVSWTPAGYYITVDGVRVLHIVLDKEQVKKPTDIPVDKTDEAMTELRVAYIMALKEREEA